MKKTIYTLIIIAFSSFSLMAQEQVSTNKGLKGGFPIPSLGIYGGPNGTGEGVVGAIGGTVDVSASGGAVYTIPLSLPPGIRGMEPSLSIVYNNQIGNGLLGWDWDLGGLSAVTRTNHTIYHHGQWKGVNFNDDSYALDGQRLINVNGLADTVSGAEYRTEIDCMSKIVSYTCDTTKGPAYFKVWADNGNIMEYGNTYDSRVGLQQKKDVCLWLLNRVEDREGNYMQYHYIKGGASYRISSIEYTGHKDIPFYRVDFEYDTIERFDKEKSFICNNTLDRAQLLKHIVVKYCGEEIERYSFVYYEIDAVNGYPYNRLKEIHYNCGGMSYNPTTIVWNDNENNYWTPDNECKIPISNYDPSGLPLHFKFSGDFNGDGLSDVIVFKKDFSHERYYLTLEINDYSDGIRFRFAQNIDVSKDINWVYVYDLNKDGKDDIVIVERNTSHWLYDELRILPYRTEELDNNNVELVPISTSFDDEVFRIAKYHSETLLIGDFFGKNRVDMAIQIPDGNWVSLTVPKWIYMTGNAEATFFSHKVYEETFLPGTKFISADFNGDGITEIWCASDDVDKGEDEKSLGNRNVSYMVKLKTRHEASQRVLSGISSWHEPFLGDFNGDGKIDFLTYVPNDSGGIGTWQVSLYADSKLAWPQYDITNIMPINKPGNHTYSIWGRLSDDFRFIDTGDFDGDGKSDLMVIPYYFTGYWRDLYLFIGPLHWVDDNHLEARFASKRCFDMSAIGLHGTSKPQYICTGNFLGREYKSLFQYDFMFHAPCMTDRYAVSSIIDGMGNQTDFQYSYPEPNTDGFYTRTIERPELKRGAYVMSLPIKVLKKVTTWNPTANTPKICVEHKLENAIMHMEGRGFLGFTKTVTYNISNDTYHHLDKINTCYYSMNAMGNHCALSLDYECDSCKFYVYNSYRTQLSAETFYNNTYLEKASRNGVFVPIVTRQRTLTYSLNSATAGEVTCNTVLHNEFQIDSQSADTICYGYYNNSVKLLTTINGVTDDGEVENVEDCEYQTKTVTTYQPETLISLRTWIINRPESTLTIASQLNDTVVSQSLVKYDYKSPNSYLPKVVTTYPGGNESNENGLATSITYKYDALGNVLNETLSALDGMSESRKTVYQYQRERFLCSEKNALGYETRCLFDNAYGNILYSWDVNSEETRYMPEDHLGITDWVKYPDSTYRCVAKRWAKNTLGDYYEDDAPEGAAYMVWERSTGTAPVMVFYDAANREKRSVTFGLNEKIVYQDTYYNDKGLLDKKSLPYFKGTDNSGIQWIIYDYDELYRLKSTNNPDGTRIVIDYADNYTKTTFYASGNNNAPSQTSIHYYNCLEQNTKTKDSSGQEVQYGYYPDGKLKWTQVGNDQNTRINLEYDDAGNRTMIHDPNYGKLIEKYDAYGQLLMTITPKGDTTKYEYDNIGRLEKRYDKDHRTHSVELTRWDYSNTEGSKGLLISVSCGNKHKILYSYDHENHNRTSSVTESIFGHDYVSSYGYDDDLGFPLRVNSIQNSSGYSMHNIFDERTGQLVELQDSDGLVLWRTDSLNAAGKITSFTMGNGVTSKRNYDQRTARLKEQLSGPNNNIQNIAYDYDFFGNLASRYDIRNNMLEEFRYDNLNRLDTTILNREQWNVMTYDELGRMTSKQAYGETVFFDASFDFIGSDGQLRPHAISSASMERNPFPTERLNVDYTMFDKVNRIYLSPYPLQFDYGFDHQRIRMYDESFEKVYAGNCEYVTEDGQTTVYTYLDGPLGVFAVVESNGMGETLHYIYKDHLGSWTTITDSNANIEQDVSYDAWGNIRCANDWNEPYQGTPMFSRGFTGHEHLCDIGLINMNGRMYDPIMSSFLSVDSYVQCPDNSQNFNRYSYCLNNPLGYTDPSGEAFGVDDALIVAVAVSVTVNVTMNGINNQIYNIPFFRNAGKVALVGAMEGVFSYGIGEVAMGLDGIGKVLFQMGAHGALNGCSSLAKGGEFWPAFASGAAASLIGGATAYLTRGAPRFWRSTATIAAGGLSGGTASVISGGRFWDGVCNGLISAGLNHAMHLSMRTSKGFIIACCTKQPRHILGPDALVGSITMDGSSGIAMSAEGGGIAVLVGGDRGFYSYADLGVGVGLVTSSMGIELVEMYSSSTTDEVKLSDFSGSRWEGNASFAAFGINLGITAIYSNRYDEYGNNSGFTLGIGATVGGDLIPFKINVSINYGATSTGNVRGLPDELRKAYSIKRP